MGVAPTGGRVSYTAPSDVMADLPPNEQVRMREGEGGREIAIATSKKHCWGVRWNIRHRYNYKWVWQMSRARG